jgi:hypothetical protein
MSSMAIARRAAIRNAAARSTAIARRAIMPAPMIQSAIARHAAIRSTTTLAAIAPSRKAGNATRAASGPTAQDQRVAKVAATRHAARARAGTIRSAAGMAAMPDVEETRRTPATVGVLVVASTNENGGACAPPSLIRCRA